jgi:hypothetical protein
MGCQLEMESGYTKPMLPVRLKLTALADARTSDGRQSVRLRPFVSTLAEALNTKEDPLASVKVAVSWTSPIGMGSE